MEKKKILLIEDDNDLVINIRSILKEENYDVKIEIDGESGIKSAKQWQPDLILCDISIPKKDGYEVLEVLSKNKTTRRIPFIFLTAKVETENFRKGMQLGADDYIFKPFDIDDLLNSINIRIERAAGKLKDEATEENKGNKKNKKYGINDRILINFGNEMRFCSVKEIKIIKSENPYIRLKFINGKSTLQRQTLGEWILKLPEMYFIQINKSIIINTEYVLKIEKISKTSYLIKLRDENETFIVSRRYSKNLVALLP
jgi:DNA-binding response OmpR family regulator